MKCNAVHWNSIKCTAVHCSKHQYSAVHFSKILQRTALCLTVNNMQYSTMYMCVVYCITVQGRMVWCIAKKFTNVKSTKYSEQVLEHVNFTDAQICVCTKFSWFCAIFLKFMLNNWKRYTFSFFLSCVYSFYAFFLKVSQRKSLVREKCKIWKQIILKY